MKGYDHEQWMTNEEIGLFTFYKQRDPSRKAEKMQLSRSRRGLPHFIRTGEKQPSAKSIRLKQTNHTAKTQQDSSARKTGQVSDKMQETCHKIRACARRVHTEEQGQYLVKHDFWRNSTRTQFKLNKKNFNASFRYNIEDVRSRMFLKQDEMTALSRDSSQLDERILNFRRAGCKREELFKKQGVTSPNSQRFLALRNWMKLQMKQVDLPSLRKAATLQKFQKSLDSKYAFLSLLLDRRKAASKNKSHGPINN